MKFSKAFMVSLVAGMAAFAASTHTNAQNAQTQAEVAATPTAFLQLEITSTCSDKGAVFKIINRGNKWPRTGYLRLYHADDKSMIGERRLRLAPGQKVSFVVKDSVSKGRPVAVWVDPEWYQRDFEYDASLKCH